MFSINMRHTPRLTQCLEPWILDIFNINMQHTPHLGARLLTLTLTLTLNLNNNINMNINMNMNMNMKLTHTLAPVVHGVSATAKTSECRSR